MLKPMGKKKHLHSLSGRERIGDYRYKQERRKRDIHKKGKGRDAGI